LPAAKAHFSCLLFALLASNVPAVAQNVLTTDQWREDLHFLARQIPDAHRDIFHAVTRADFDAAVSDIDRRIPELSDHEIVIEFTRLLAMLGEGHTRISLPDQPEAMDPAGRESGAIAPAKYSGLGFRRLPLKLILLTDGLFVSATTPEFKDLLGAQVLQIGDRSAMDALQAIQPVISRDNDMGFRLVAPEFASLPEILSALKITADSSRVPLRLRTARGQELTRELTALALNSSPEWVDAFDTGQVARPLYLRQPERHYWFVYLDETRTVYARINAILDSPQLTVAAFSNDLLTFIHSHEADRLALDLRGSPGGNNQLFPSILLGLIREAKINQPGKLFVLIDRGTFSAATGAAGDLERLTNAIFIGEPTGGSPNSWGDPKRITLPNSGLVARLSSIYWRDSTVDTSRTSIAPDIQTPLSSKDYFDGRDRALEAASQFPQRLSFGDLLEKILSSGGGLASVQRLYYQRKWAGDSTKEGIQRLGVYFISGKSYQAAFAAFALNFRDYPDSLATAIEAAQTARSQDPNDKALADLVGQLSELRNRR
jgi:hypothetical protein